MYFHMALRGFRGLCVDLCMFSYSFAQGFNQFFICFLVILGGLNLTYSAVLKCLFSDGFHTLGNGLYVFSDVFLLLAGPAGYLAGWAGWLAGWLAELLGWLAGPHENTVKINWGPCKYHA